MDNFDDMIGITPMQISKLGHEIDEIRSRALSSICSKYNLQLVDENNVQISKDILERLLNWFNFDKHLDEERVLKLMLRVLQSTKFAEIVEDLGVDCLLQRVKDIEQKTEKRFLPIISDIKDLILEATKTKTTVVSPVEIPTEMEAGATPEPILDPSTVSFVLEESAFEEDDAPDIPKVPTPITHLPWLSLIKQDLAVLSDAYEGLRYFGDPRKTLLTCQLLRESILKDFPAELFVQRPVIILTLLEHVKASDEDTLDMILKVLVDYAECLALRICWLKMPQNRGTRWRNNDIAEVGKKELQEQQMSIPELAKKLLCAALTVFKTDVALSRKNLALTILLHVGQMLKEANIPDLGLDQPLLNLFEDCLVRASRHHYLALMSGLMMVATTLTPLLSHHVLTTITDPSVFFTFPRLHRKAIALASLSPQLANIQQEMKTVEDMCKSIESAQKLVAAPVDNVPESCLSVPECFEFHRNLHWLWKVMCLSFSCHAWRLGLSNGNEKRHFAAKYLCMLLNQTDPEVRALVGNEIATAVEECEVPKEQIVPFPIFFDFDVWHELVMGATSSDDTFRSPCQRILTVLLRRALSPGRIMKEAVQTADLLACLADVDTDLGLQVRRVMLPFSTKNPSITSFLLRGNLCLLFSLNPEIRTEAFIRLGELLEREDAEKAKQVAGRTILSDMCVEGGCTPLTLEGVGLPTGECVAELLDTAKHAKKGMELFNALMALAAELLSPSQLLRFLELKGLDFVLEYVGQLMEVEEMIMWQPFARILLALVTSQPSVMTNLTTNRRFLFDAFRLSAAFYLQARGNLCDPDWLQPMVHLLFLLAFCDRIDQMDGISVERRIAESMHVPFHARVHDRSSHYWSIAQNRKETSSLPHLAPLLRAFWLASSVGGTVKLAALAPKDLGKLYAEDFPAANRMTEDELMRFKNGAVLRSTVLSLLQACHTADSYASAMAHVTELHGYIVLARMESALFIEEEHVHKSCNHPATLESLPWTDCLGRFFVTPPATQDDARLLAHVIQLIALARSLLVSLKPWVTQLLSDPKGVILRLLRTPPDPADGLSGREVRCEALHLAHVALGDGELSLDEMARWRPMCHMILEQLKGSAASLDQHLLLPLLEHITRASGEGSIDFEKESKLYLGLISKLMDVLMLSKDISNDSFARSSVVETGLFALNHLLAPACEDNSQVMGLALKRALCGTGCSGQWLLSLAHHRELCVRLATFQLLAMLFRTDCNRSYLAQGLNLVKVVPQMWTMALEVLVDDGECCNVRQKACDFLVFLTAANAKPDRKFLELMHNQNLFNEVEKFVVSVSARELGDDLSEPYVTIDLIRNLVIWLDTACSVDGSGLVVQHIANTNLISTLMSVVNSSATEPHWLELIATVTMLVTRSVKAGCATVLALSQLQQTMDLIITLWPMAQYERGDMTPQLEQAWTQIIILLATLLETQEGCESLRASTAECFVNFFTGITRLFPFKILRPHMLCLLNNMVVGGFGTYFALSLPGGSLGEQICQYLLEMDLSDSASTLSGLLLVCAPAQAMALRRGLPDAVFLQMSKLKESLPPSAVHMSSPEKDEAQLTMERVGTLLELLGNLCLRNASAKLCLVKICRAGEGLASAVHQFWPWLLTFPSLLITALKVLVNFTHKTEKAGQSIALTRTRLDQRKVSLMDSLVAVVAKEMEIFNPDLKPVVLCLSLQVLMNSSLAVECRVGLARAKLLDSLTPLLTSRKHCSAIIAWVWLSFLDTFTMWPDWQLLVAQHEMAMELLIKRAIALGPKCTCIALNTLVHLARHPDNHARLITWPSPLLALIKDVLKQGPGVHLLLASAVLWALAANSIRIKAALRDAGMEEAAMGSAARVDSKEAARALIGILAIVFQSDRRQ